jgi:hypothetical protein
MELLQLEHVQPAPHTVSVEQQAAAALVSQYFITSPGRLRAWLVYDAKSHGGLLFLIGSVRPNKRKLKRLKHLLDVAEVAPIAAFQNTLLTHGPEGLCWNGVRVTRAGH